MLIAGMAGADPAGLAAAVATAGWTERVVVATTVAEVDAVSGEVAVAVLAIDSSMPAGDEEDVLLAALADAEVPTALAACRVDAFPGWPKVLAASRARLDPDRRLPVFATAAVLAEVQSASSGVPALVQWCRERPAAAVPARRAVVHREEPRSEPLAAVRADRLAGMRAGIVSARAEAVEAIRAAVTELGRSVPEACTAPEFTTWLPAVLDGLERRAAASFGQRLDQVRSAAICGLSRNPAPQALGEESRGGPDVPHPQARRRPEDAMVLLVGASMGFGVGRMVITPALQWVGLGAVGTVLALLAGIALAGWVVTVRRSAAERARLERWAAEFIAARRGRLEHRIAARAGAAEAQFTREIWSRTRVAHG
ncbi:hypothetical protein [Gordonia neofelifaecis]|nr:hypothetical protein [Gordonia neofelifaecis]